MFFLQLSSVSKYKPKTSTFCLIFSIQFKKIMHHTPPTPTNSPVTEYNLSLVNQKGYSLSTSEQTQSMSVTDILISLRNVKSRNSLKMLHSMLSEQQCQTQFCLICRLSLKMKDQKLMLYSN